MPDVCGFVRRKRRMKTVDVCWLVMRNWRRRRRRRFSGQAGSTCTLDNLQ